MLNGRTVWRRAGAPGHETDFVITSNGVLKTRITDPEHKLVFAYDPGEPEILSGMSPGETRQSSYTVRAADISAPDQTKATGQVTVSLTYSGVYQVTTAVGQFTAHGFTKVLTDKVGPSVIDTTLYVFYSEGTGEIARIDHTDVHALMFYNRDTRAGYLLDEIPVFSTP